MSATTHQTLDEILNLLREKRRDKWWWLKSILQYPRIVVSPGPYLSFLHSIISLPLGALYFAATWILLGAGCVTFVIGIGLLLLVLMSLGLKAMTIIELFLAKHLLKFTLYRSASFVVSNCSKTNKTRPNNKNIISNNPALNRSNIGIGGGDINGIIIDNIGSNNGLIGRPTPLPYANSVNYSAYDEIGVDLHCSNKKKLSEKVKDLVFSAETGFGLLFTVVKVPVCVIVLALSVLFVLLPLFMIASPLLHVVCSNNKCYSVFAACLQRPKPVANAFNAVVGLLPLTIVLCIAGVVLTPFFLFLIEKLSNMSRNAVLILGDSRDAYEELE
eukprot:GEZU01005368.1.p1 GENE.GEZU01005368.1~~GEZU01005368.1.p1  ORF type:complete len:330 (+),score=38.78 GEZU01005368.1:146-1135(+)